jgi:glutamate--cysteine ligase
LLLQSLCPDIISIFQTDNSKSRESSLSQHILEKLLLSRRIESEAWLREQWRLTPPPFYASVDLRNANFKIAPVDTNLFPAGFNNLNPDFMTLCVQAAQATVAQICPDVSRILLIPESHTRNQFYLENVASLQEILTTAGFSVRIGSLLETLQKPEDIILSSGKKLHLEPLIKKENRIGVADFFPCLVLLNNDFSVGVPKILQETEQKIMPPLALGWATRLKSHHFKHYQEVTAELANKINIDPWLITPLFHQCGEVNFMMREGEECVAHYVEILLQEIAKKYQEHGITAQPFVTVKADAGTYGMAVMMVKSADEIRQLNRKQRTRMSSVKNGKPVTQVIIQEGVYTAETRNDHAAEPVIYMIGPHVVGGFYRVHSERGEAENLNAPGMHFVPLPFSSPCNQPIPDCDDDVDANRFYIYGLIARLALVAAARELAEVKEKSSCC